MHREAFPTPAEARLVALLRERGDAAVSLLAEAAGRVVGHVVLSPVTLAEYPTGSEGRGLLALGPVAVTPAWQGRGIGSALVREAVREARDARASAIFVLGDPEFYGRLGFESAAARGYTSDYTDGPAFRVAPLRDPLPAAGRVRWSPAFADAGV